MMDEFSRSGEQKWTELIGYGISSGAFNEVNTAELVNIILFSYQGVRMWSKIATLDEKRVNTIIHHIRKQLLKGDEVK